MANNFEIPASIEPTNEDNEIQINSSLLMMQQIQQIFTNQKNILDKLDKMEENYKTTNSLIEKLSTNMDSLKTDLDGVIES